VCLDTRREVVSLWRKRFFTDRLALDLCAREWQSCALKEDEFVASADEKTAIQARRRKHVTPTCRHTFRVVHTPIRAIWLIQIEIYFSIVQRKVLTANDFTPNPEGTTPAVAPILSWPVSQRRARRRLASPDQLSAGSDSWYLHVVSACYKTYERRQENGF